MFGASDCDAKPTGPAANTPRLCESAAKNPSKRGGKDVDTFSSMERELELELKLKLELELEFELKLELELELKLELKLS